jgi:HEAT repeat protein
MVMPTPTIDDLIAQLADTDAHTRRKARQTIALIGEPAVPRLSRLLDSPSVPVRWNAAKTLADIATPSSIPGLAKILSDEEFDIRWIAAEGLVAVGPTALPPMLRMLIEEPDSAYIRHGARHVLKGLSTGNDVIEELVHPVIAALGDMTPGSVVLEKAGVALDRICALQGITC